MSIFAIGTSQLVLTINELKKAKFKFCLLYTSDAADERSSVDLGGRRIIKKKKTRIVHSRAHLICTNNDNYTIREQQQ